MKCGAYPLIFVLFVVSFIQAVTAVNLIQCRDQIRQDAGWPNVTSSTNSSLTSPTVADPGKNITYSQCLKTCGSGVGAFNWTPFSQSFSTWLLPWIALIFQLPFGAENRFDNLVSVLLAIGSPALAGYSLAITRLNGKWLEQEFKDRVNYPNSNKVPTVFSALQHVPIKLVRHGALLPSLVVLPQNDQWWTSMERAAMKTRQWNIPAAMNILWVTIAFLITIVDSFADFSNFLSIPGDTGYAVLAVWSYLLPLVVGWLNVGSQPEANHLQVALEEVSLNAWVATDHDPVPASERRARESRAVYYGKRDVRGVQSDEKRTAPIFNYSRVFKWSQDAQHILLLYENASEKAERKISVNGTEWVPGENGIASKNRTGSEGEVIGYCFPEDIPPSPFPISEGTSSPLKTPDIKVEELPYFIRRDIYSPLWPSHVIERVCSSFLLGILLQWGSSGAAILIHMQTPPQGLGCRALTFLLYGVLGTAVLIVMVLSSVLAHIARPLPNSNTTTAAQNVAGQFAILFRWAGKVLGVMGGLGILITSIMQFSGVYDNCYCSSMVFWGKPEGLLYLMNATDVKGSTVYKYWIGGTAMAFGSDLVYAFAIYISSPMV